MGEAYLTSPLSTTSKTFLGSVSYSGSGSFYDRESTYLSLDTHNIQSYLTTGFISMVVDLNFKGYVGWLSYPDSFSSRFFISFGNTGDSLFSVSGPYADSSNRHVNFDVDLKGELGAICQDSSYLLVPDVHNLSGSSITAYAYGGNRSVFGSLSCTVSGTISFYKV